MPAPGRYVCWREDAKFKITLGQPGIQVTLFWKVKNKTKENLISHFQVKKISSDIGLRKGDE